MAGDGTVGAPQGLGVAVTDGPADGAQAAGAVGEQALGLLNAEPPDQRARRLAGRGDEQAAQVAIRHVEHLSEALDAELRVPETG